MMRDERIRMHAMGPETTMTWIILLGLFLAGSSDVRLDLGSLQEVTK